MTKRKGSGILRGMSPLMVDRFGEIFRFYVRYKTAMPTIKISGYRDYSKWEVLHDLEKLGYVQVFQIGRKGYVNLTPRGYSVGKKIKIEYGNWLNASREVFFS